MLVLNNILLKLTQSRIRDEYNPKTSFEACNENDQHKQIKIGMKHCDFFKPECAVYL